MTPPAPDPGLDRAAEHFARNQYRDWVIYSVLAERETNAEFKRILEELIGHELEDYGFWLALSPRKRFRIGPSVRVAYRAIRRLFGLTFTAKLLERREKEMIRQYRGLLAEVRDEGIRAAIAGILEHESLHESRLIGEVRERNVEFLSNIVLGLNDGLIELTGALVGFSFAFRRTPVVALAGAITGIAATLSMSASAFMQARHEAGGKDPLRAAAYTGGAYLGVVALLILPYALIGSLYPALAAMGGIVAAIVAAASFYSAVILERRFATQMIQMTLFSVGVALVAFFLGLLLRSATGVSP